MNEFVSLSPSGLPEEFDVELYSEKPVVSVEELEDRIEIGYIFPGFTMGDNEQQLDDQTLPFKEVGISGAGFVSESGKPVKIENILVTLVTPAQEQATDQADETGVLNTTQRPTEKTLRIQRTW